MRFSDPVDFKGQADFRQGRKARLEMAINMEEWETLDHQRQAYLMERRVWPERLLPELSVRLPVRGNFR